MIRQKLEAYRRKKQKEEMIETMKSSIKGVLPWSSSFTTHETLPDTSLENQKISKEKSEELTAKPKQVLQDSEDVEGYYLDESVEDMQVTSINRVLYLLYFILWVTLYIIALEIEFGAVYFVISTLIIIWFNTRSRPRKKGEPSAYSVFNPNCEAIEGTLDASQFEREIRYGISGLH